MTEREQAFGDYLRTLREERAIELFEVARKTRIPMRSLKKLEAGDFECLPADIFVRGFIRSYTDSVGLAGDDATAVMDRYLELGRKAPALSGDVAAAARRSREERKDATLLPAPGASDESQRTRAILPRLSDSEKESRRGGSVTVAVIIFVIVATLAMSYLLRKPSSESDDFTRIPNESPSSLMS